MVSITSEIVHFYFPLFVHLNSIIYILRKGSVLQKVFITLAKKFTRISELTPEVLHTFIDKIVVHERAERYKQKSEQQIDIYFTHIGNLNEF